MDASASMFLLSPGFQDSERGDKFPNWGERGGKKRSGRNKKKPAQRVCAEDPSMGTGKFGLKEKHGVHTHTHTTIAITLTHLGGPGLAWILYRTVPVSRSPRGCRDEVRQPCALLGIEGVVSQ